MANLKEMRDMVDGDFDLAEGTEVVEQLKAEIDRMFKDVKEFTHEEKQIMDSIQETLDEHELKYSYDEDEPKHIGIGFSMENKPFKVHIILQNGKVIIKLSFPFRVQANAIALMGIYMTEFNSSGTAFSPLSTDFDNGELYMDYSYLLEKPEDFDKESFWVYMTSHIKFALEIYTKVAHLSVGMVPRKDRKLYKKLLEIAMETVNGDFDDDNTSYGTESLKSDSLPDLSDLFGKDDGNEGKEDDSELDYEDIKSDIVRRLRKRRRVSSFEEFLRMKMQTEGDSEEGIEEQPEKASGMLSMFAKRDDKKDTKVVGGNEDE